MRSRSFLRFTLPLLLLFAYSARFSSAAVKNRIASVNGTARIPLPHTIPARARAATDLGEAPAGQQLSSLMLTFNMTDAQQAALTQLLIDLQDPSSPRYHQWLTPEQFGAQFGLSSTDIAQVSTWLSSQGFTITGVARASNYITFSGTAAQVQQAFGTTLHSISVDGETHISNLTDPVLPAGFAAVVSNFFGLNDFKLKPRVHSRTVTLPTPDATGLHPNYTQASTGVHMIAPGDFYTIYNESPLLASSINGQGVSIAIMGQTDISLTDVAAFRTASGLCTTVTSTCPNPLPTVKLIGSDPGTSPGDLDEAMLDVEWAGAVAPNANIIYVNSTNVFSSLTTAIGNNLAPIISISYGDCEANFASTNSLAPYNLFFQQANAQGQTIVGPAGDSGATDCDFDDYPAVGGLAVDFPASSPYVTAAGGSMFSESSTPNITYWNTNTSSSTNNAGSALSYIPEAVWNETNTTNGLGAGGGGISAYFSKPYWQATITPADSSRDVPDISLNSAFNHDGSLYCVSGSCVNGTFLSANGQSIQVVGGTSVAAPSFAGILALILQKVGPSATTTGGLGNIGPQLYALAANPAFYNSTSSSVFHDIAIGNNSSPCTIGTPNCSAGGPIGYSAGPGYDRATGIGSVNVYNLVTDWNLVSPIPSIPAVGGSTPSLTTVTASSTSSPICGTPNANLIFSVNVTSGSTNSTPTGTVQLFVDGTASGSSVALASGAATLTLVTTGLASGSHIVYAVYSGDTVFSGSKGTISTDVVSSTAPDFIFTPCAANVTTSPGGTATGITFTLAPVNGFTGVVTFNATSLDSVNATYTFTPVTVTTSGTTSFVLFAYSSDAITNTSGRLRLKTANLDSPRAPWCVPVSGATLACGLLLVLPRRRRWPALLGIVLSVAALGAAIGCGGSSVSTGGGNNGGGNNGGGGGTVITPAARGIYNIQVSASGTTTGGVTVSHSTTVTFTVQ